MPMYEYACRACGSRFERLVWRTGDPDPHCACGSAQVERIPYSRVAVGSARPQPACSDSPCAPAGCCGGGACQMD